jgi:hypothetical protein
MTRTTKNKICGILPQEISKYFENVFIHVPTLQGNEQNSTWADIQTTLILVSLAQYLISLMQDSSALEYNITGQVGSSHIMLCLLALE